MRFKWTIPVAVALLAVALAILLGQAAGQAQGPLVDLEVIKTVDPPVTASGETVVYSVFLSNTTAMTLEVSSVMDILPSSDFEYAGLAPGHQWLPPSQVLPTEIRWDGPITVPMSGLELSYYIHVHESVPPSAVPYTNTVIATYKSTPYATQAGLLVGMGDAFVTKTADPVNVEPGGLVTYTVSFSNSGYVPMTLTTVVDALPEGVTFIDMTAGSDLPSPPVGVTETVVWTGAYTIPARSRFDVAFLASMPVTSDTLFLENQAWGELEDGTPVGPAYVEVLVSTEQPYLVYLPEVFNHWAPAIFAVTKSADPVQVDSTAPGALVTYTVEFVNSGTEQGVLANVHDTLPAGFTFVKMMPSSDVLTPPAGTTGEIVWSGPLAVPGESSLVLIYQVRASTTPGSYTNLVTATVSEGLPLRDSASASVEVIEPLLLVEDFQSPSPYWEPFLNYWRLHPEQWYYMAGGGADGSKALRHNYALGVVNPLKGAHDALFMYQEPGSELWTDYVYEVDAVLNADDGTGRGQIGVWFRGTYQEHEEDGLWVTGYYFSLDPYPSKHVYLWQLRTDEECGDDCAYNYHFSNPLLLEELDNAALQALGIDLVAGRWYRLKVEVDGPQIRCYIDDILVFDYYDNVGTTFEQGTVGFVTYIAADARWDNVSVTRLP
jgi:uncharacterized repeat protein (TIGR01451 family)